MKAFISSIVVFISLVILVSIHTHIITHTSREILNHCQSTEAYAKNGQWPRVVAEIDRIKEIRQKNKLWTELTLSTAINREIDSTLARSHAFAVLCQAPDFSGEFATFKTQIEYLILRESLYPGELF